MFDVGKYNDLDINYSYVGWLTCAIMLIDEYIEEIIIDKKITLTYIDNVLNDLDLIDCELIKLNKNYKSDITNNYVNTYVDVNPHEAKLMYYLKSILENVMTFINKETNDEKEIPTCKNLKRLITTTAFDVTQILKYNIYNNTECYIRKCKLK